jgi:hypothetical protein
MSTRPPATRALLEEADASLLDIVDNVLTKGVVIDGEIMLGLAGVDLIYLRLGVVLCAADRITGYYMGGPDMAPHTPPDPRHAPAKPGRSSKSSGL